MDGGSWLDLSCSWPALSALAIGENVDLSERFNEKLGQIVFDDDTNSFQSSWIRIMKARSRTLILFWIGTILSGLAALLGLLSTETGSGVQPMSSIAVGVAAFAFLYASNSGPAD
jgi:hypothetical protein